MTAEQGVDRRSYVPTRHGRKLFMEAGFRYGRWTVLDLIGERALLLCDCGSVRIRGKTNVASGASTSCGCRRAEVSAGSMRKVSAEWLRRNWETGVYSKEQASAAIRAQNEAQKGQPASGRAAKGVNHHNAKRYVVRGPSGVILEGVNLSHMVRTHPHLFAPDDVKVRTNKYGTEIDCKAMRGLRILFATPTKRPRHKSWKGWVAVEGPNLNAGEGP